MRSSAVFSLLAVAGHVTAAPAQPATPVLEERAVRVNVAVKPGATVAGTSLLGVESFRGIPYAQPPVGQLRLKPPQKLASPPAFVDATGIAAACPQMFFSTGSGSFLTQVLGDLLNNPLIQTVTQAREDCLTVSVQRPAGTKAGAKLPVLFWIFGGGFELGSTQMYDASGLLGMGNSLAKPFVFVAVNYRVGGFGFMPGKEILKDGSANLGLLDQRLGLEWVADNIEAFGGDPDKVTIWGESAGAISVLDQMMLYGGNNTYNGKPLFRGAIMNSGTVVPADPVDAPKGQKVYDTVVRSGGCAGQADTLKCLRGLSYDKFLDAANSVPGLLSYTSVALSYLPRPDGTALPRSPDAMIAAGQYAAVPMIVGNQEDEGTLFSLFQSNVTSTADLETYLGEVFFNKATKKQIKDLVATYNPFITEGSPFGTGIFNEIYPGFKRLAAILGDLVFTLSRRAFLNTAQAVNPSVPAWSYLASYNFGTPILGTFHGSDLLQVFYGILPNYASASIQTYYINFLYNLDPNVGTTRYMKWPKWGEDKQMMQFFSKSASLLKDDFRSDSYNFIAKNLEALYF